MRLLLLLHVGATISWTRFTIHPSTVIGIMVLGALYAWRAQQGARTGHATRRSQRATFFVALATMFFALNGWIHDLSDYYLFSAHMLQHLLLALVVAPLLIAGTPGWMVQPSLRVRALGAVVRWLTQPLRAFAIFNVVFAAWHLPLLYNLAMAHHGVHIVQHLMFLAASVVMWWPILSDVPEVPRLSYPLQLLYVFLMSIAMSIVSIYIVYADTTLYPAYASAPRLWGISPMQDQLIGGLIMWIPGGLYFLGVLSVIFFLWQREDAARDARDAPPESSPVAAGLPARR